MTDSAPTSDLHRRVTRALWAKLRRRLLAFRIRYDRWNRTGEWR